LNNRITLSFEEGKIFDYEKKIFAQGEGGLLEEFLPMSFIYEEGIEFAVYDVSGFMPISLYPGLLKADEAFSYFETIVKAVIKAGENLIIPERIGITKSTIYVNAEKQSLKIMYVPDVNGNSTVNEKLEKFLSEIEDGDISANLRGYIEAVKDKLSKNCSIYDLLRFISNIKREIYICGAI